MTTVNLKHLTSQGLYEALPVVVSILKYYQAHEQQRIEEMMQMHSNDILPQVLADYYLYEQKRLSKVLDKIQDTALQEQWKTLCEDGMTEDDEEMLLVGFALMFHQKEDAVMRGLQATFSESEMDEEVVVPY